MRAKHEVKQEQRRKCEGCNFHFVISRLFTVGARRLCEPCGKMVIAQWNSDVRQAEDSFKAVSL